VCLRVGELFKIREKEEDCSKISVERGEQGKRKGGNWDGSLTEKGANFLPDLVRSICGLLLTGHHRNQINSYKSKNNEKRERRELIQSEAVGKRREHQKRGVEGKKKRAASTKRKNGF